MIRARTFLLYVISFMWIMWQALCGYVPVTNIKNVCERPWALVFAHSAEGKTWVGSKHYLMRDVTAGKEVKVTLLDVAETIQIRVDNVNFRRREVCAESLSHLAHNGTHIKSDAPRLYMMVCTSGLVNILEENGHQYRVRQPMYWYTKDWSDQGKPVYSHYVDGSPGSGSLQNLWTAARTMALRAVMRDRGYSFPLHNVALDPTSGVVTGQSVKHIGQTIRGPVVQFNRRPYLWFSSWSTSGQRDNKRWQMGYRHEAKGHNVDRAALDWYADVCWRGVYSHDAGGHPEFGSVEQLIEEVRNGHRVRLTIDGVTFEASNVRVSGKVITAQVLDAMIPERWSGPERSRIREDTAYRWMLVHTTGKVRSYEHLVGGSSSSSSAAASSSSSSSSTASRALRGVVESRAVTWSVDTRSWRVMLRTVDQGRVVEGSPHLLRKAVEQGASIRVNLGMDEQSKDFLTEPDSVRIDEINNIVYAQAMNHISDKKARDPNEYELQHKVFHWYLMLGSDGSVRMSAWYVGKNERLYDKRAPSANLTWFACF